MARARAFSRKQTAFALVLVVSSACRSETIPPPPPAPAVAEGALPTRGGTLLVAVGEDIRTLDPQRTIDTVSLFGGQLLFGTLLDYPREGIPTRDNLEPSLAEAWTTSAEGLTLTFTLREAARYSEGSPVVAEDFVYAIDRILAPETGSPVASFFAGIEGAGARLAGKAKVTTGLRALGPKTLQIRLERPDPSFPLLLTMIQTTPQKRSYVEAQGDQFSTRPLGAGMFRLRSYTPGQELFVERNPFFWSNERPFLDGVRIRLAMPRESMLLSFLQGDIDILDARICEDALLITREPLWAPYIERAPIYATTADMFNTQKPPFSDKRVRQAFNYAINREDSARLSNGRVIPANGFLPPQMLGHNKDRPVWPLDREKAKLLLAQAGYEHGLEVTYTTLRDEMAQKIALSMRDDLEKVGVRMNIETLTFPAYLASLSRGDLSFAFSGWTMDFPDPWDFLEVKFHSRMIAAGTNDTGYQNTEVDKLLDSARVELDEKKRGALYQKAEDIIIDDCPNLWHYFVMSVDIRQPRVKGRIRHPARDLFFRDTWIAGE